MARELGAQVIVTSGKSLVSTALEVARREKVTHIVVGKQFGRNIIGRLSRESNEVDIYVVNSEPEKVRSKRKFVFNADGVPSYKQYAIVLAALILIVIACLPLAWATDYHVSFIMSFSVLALSWIFRLKVGPVAFASALGAYLWVVFFVQPYNTLKGIDPHDVIAILVFFFITFATGVIASKASQNERLTKKREEKTDALFRLTDRLAQADTSEGILAIAKEEIRNHFGMEAYFILQDGVGALTREQIDAEPEGFDYSEFSIAKWAFRHSSKAGKYTNTFSVGKFTFFPLPGLNISPGVAAIRSRKRIDSETEIFLKRFLLQISGAMEHLYYSLRAKNADLMFESDRLYRGLFNSVSHELRIPVASVMGAADTLLSVEPPPEIRTELLETILAASTRLSQLIDNLLNISRLENGKISARMNWVDVNDLFNRVADSLKEELEPFRMEIIVPPSMPLVRLDFGLMEQALYNLVDNSCKYAAAGTTITLKAFYDNGYLVMQESDHGPGFVEKEMPLAFNKFYRADNQSGAGLGLGLSIVKGFIEAHGGTIGIKNRRNGGAEFTMKIPTEISYVDKV
jgi:two-component system sensor histidine kinase KdpD